MEEGLHQFSNAKYFSELDLSRAYYQIKLTESARQFTAKTRLDLMEFVRLPFGSINASSAWAQLMKIVLRGLKNVTFYFDNIYVYGETLVPLSCIRASVSQVGTKCTYC